MYVHRGLIANKIIYVSVFDSSFLYNYVANHTLYESYPRHKVWPNIVLIFIFTYKKRRSHLALERIIRTIDHGAVDI